MDNYVHDNNNPNVPAPARRRPGPVGTGMSVSGGRNDTIMHNRFVNNKAWGVDLRALHRQRPPCTGGHRRTRSVRAAACSTSGATRCINNTFIHNGCYGHPTNGDFEQLNLETHPTDCFSGNTDPAGLIADVGQLAGDPPDVHRRRRWRPEPHESAVPQRGAVRLAGLAGRRAAAACPSGQYPRRQRVVMHPLPRG